MGRGLSTGHVLPPNPTWITFENSDGNSHKWPTNTQPNPDSQGQLNWMRPYDHDESGSVYWRCLIAAELAKRLNMPAGPTYVLKSWPDGYKMYDHQKGPRDNPRHDPYLVGSEHVARFRSAAEFIPHALWLLTDKTKDRRNCGCKYCSKTPQRDISSTLGLSQGRNRSTPSRPPSARPPRQSQTRPQQEPTRVYAAVRRPAVPEIRNRAQAEQVAQQFMLPEREKDVRAVFSSRGLKTKRLGREGELVWCALDSNIVKGTSLDEVIHFWPGLIQETRLKAEIHARALSQDVEMADGTNGTTDTSPPTDDDVPFTVSHYTVYKVKLLAVAQECLFPDSRVIPYQAYAPSTALLLALQSTPVRVDDKLEEAANEGVNEDQKPEQRFMANFSSFSPIVPSGEPPSRFEDAAGPFALAVQIASIITSFWTPTDEWSLPLSFPKGPPPWAAAATASRANSWTQTRYQGLWWGSERIWMDDLVRLKPGRHQLAPGGGVLRPPAPASRSSLEFHEQWAEATGEGSDLDKSATGAATRGVFMRVTGLCVEDVPASNGGTRPECRMCGMLYELADQDWEDPDEAPVEGKGIDKGKGKARADEGDVDADQSFGLFSLTPASAMVPNGTDEAAATQPVLRSHSPRTGPPSPPCVLSAPPMSLHPLPPPPTGYKFRALLPQGQEAVVSLTLLSGRYYPGILEHPCLRATVAAALDGAVSDGASLWALEGLVSGVHNAVDPERWRKKRILMVKEADVQARRELYNFWREMPTQPKEEAPVVDLAVRETQAGTAGGV